MELTARQCWLLTFVCKRMQRMENIESNTDRWVQLQWLHDKLRDAWYPYRQMDYTAVRFTNPDDVRKLAVLVKMTIRARELECKPLEGFDNVTC